MSSFFVLLLSHLITCSLYWVKLQITCLITSLVTSLITWGVDVSQCMGANGCVWMWMGVSRCQYVSIRPTGGSLGSTGGQWEQHYIVNMVQLLVRSLVFLSLVSLLSSNPCWQGKWGPQWSHSSILFNLAVAICCVEIVAVFTLQLLLCVPICCIIRFSCNVSQDICCRLWQTAELQLWCWDYWLYLGSLAVLD